MKKFLGIVNALMVALLVTFSFAMVSTLSIGAIFGFASLLMSIGVFNMPSGLVGANYTASLLAKGQAKLFGMFQAGELREIEPVTFMQFRKQAEIMVPSHKILRTREDRPLEAYFMKRTVRSLGTGRAHNTTGVTGDSGVLTPSFITYNDKFSQTLKQADANVYSSEEEFSNEIANIFKNFARGFETTATAYLFANRSTVNNGVAEGTFNVVSNTFEITDTNNGLRAVQIAGTNMAENLYGGMGLTYFCDAIAFNKFEFLAKQGATNATNTSFQFQGKTFVLSLKLTASAATLGYTKGYWIVVPDGTIGVLDWIPKQNRQGVDTKVGTYATFLNPMDNLNYALWYYPLALDGTSVGGYTQDVITQYEFSQDLAFENAPLSVSGETTMQAFALV